jgi:hypothetical protein
VSFVSDGGIDNELSIRKRKLLIAERDEMPVVRIRHRFVGVCKIRLNHGNDLREEVGMMVRPCTGTWYRLFGPPCVERSAARTNTIHAMRPPTLSSRLRRHPLSAG